MRLIDADELEKRVSERTSADIDWAKTCIRTAPTIDVRPLNRGKWEMVVKDGVIEGHQCSHCGTLLPIFRGIPDYCPNCGYAMEEETNNE